MLAYSCEKEAMVEGYPEMQSFYAESCGLSAVTWDSVNAFSNKVSEFTTEYPDSKRHSLYPKILENIAAVRQGFIITVDTAWTDSKEFEY